MKGSGTKESMLSYGSGRFQEQYLNINLLTHVVDEVGRENDSSLSYPNDEVFRRRDMGESRCPSWRLARIRRNKSYKCNSFAEPGNMIEYTYIPRTQIQGQKLTPYI
jgi:hypothetical protein